MFIPVGTDRPRTKSPWLVYALIVVNTLIFLGMQVFLESRGESAVGRFYMEYAVVRDGFEWHQLLTSAFLHGGWMHLIGNMLVLAALGPNVEDKMGHLGFGALYVVAAAASGWAHILFSDHPAVGASGAIAGVTGAYLVLFPKTRIMVWVIFFVIGRFAVPAWWFIGFNIAIDLLANGFGGDTGVAHAAHLGGYAFGIMTAMILLWTHVLKREPYDLFTILKQRKRRAEFARAAQTQEVAIKKTVGREAVETPEQKAMHAHRMKIAELVSVGKLDDASNEYRVFADEYGAKKPGTSLSRDLQLRLAEHLVRSDDRRTAVMAYKAFAQTYPTDHETPNALLMASLILVRHLGRGEESLPLLEKAMPFLTGQEIALAEELKSEAE